MKRKDLLTYVIRLAVEVLSASIVGLLLLMIVYAIPVKYITDNANYGIEILKHEGYYGDYEYLFSFAWGARVDGGTDAGMLHNASAYDDKWSFIQNVMCPDDSVRYWNGYMVLMKPLLAVATYAQSRFLFMIILGILFWLIIVKSSERLGRKFSFSFLLAMMFTNLIIVPWNNIHSFGTAVYMASIVYVLYKYKKNTDYLTIFTAFGIFGIANIYFDRITVLPQSLGMPLLFMLFIDHLEYGERSLANSAKKVVCASMGWFLSLFLFWMVKWFLATIILGENVLDNAGMQMNSYFQSDGVLMKGGKTGRLYCVAKNLASLIPSHGEALPAIFAAFVLLFIIMIIVFIKKKASMKDTIIFLPEIIVMFGLPLAFYMLLTYMSLFNATCFASRYQSLWIFGGLAIYFALLDRGRQDKRLKNGT